MSGPARRPAAERFWAKVDRAEGCWLWTAYSLRDGYGRFKDGNRTVTAHRWSYEHLVGPIPEGLTLDHLCRVRRCVNPDHLEPVPFRENVLRGYGPTAVNARKTHCANGHAFDEANTYRRPQGRRGCRACNRIAVASYEKRKEPA